MSSFRKSLQFLIQHDRDQLTVRMLYILWSVQGEGKTVRDLSASMGVDKPVISRSVDRLQQEGLVVRNPDTRDRRSVFINATPAGLRLAAELAKASA